MAGAFNALIVRIAPFPRSRSNTADKSRYLVSTTEGLSMEQRCRTSIALQSKKFHAELPVASHQKSFYSTWMSRSTEVTVLDSGVLHCFCFRQISPGGIHVAK